MDKGWAEAATFLLSALRILVDPTKEFKKFQQMTIEIMNVLLPKKEMEVGRRKEDNVAIEFGVVKGDEEDYIIDILKRRPLSLYNTLLSNYKNVVQCGVSTIYAPKKHIIKKQIEKGFKRHGEICNNVTLLTGAEQMQMMSIIRLYMTLRAPHIYDDGILYIKRPSSLALTEGNAIYQGYYLLMKEKLQTKL
ncbi:LOW QUALITY PROTEIN: hypothetical protein Cgig2_017675 [Carnegiea gigantea]|uniref:Uncharacterized protein n=1 Tax=Carnegiea gigantea TaxID=171969 RepID=A0A9Q1GSS4_9CARY|nr:LOW QUALITY PROTEIN: hypothetical protein Cgig2_017675 [Carnegiea gigantea]